jgi:hypothetical protein
MAQPRTGVADGFQHDRRPIAVLNVSLMDDQPEHHPNRIRDNVALATLDLFARCPADDCIAIGREGASNPQTPPLSVVFTL